MRIRNSFRNYSYAVLGQLVNSVMGFVCRTVFIRQLNVDYLGISGLFTNILAVFSLAELGIGTAIIVHLYKPLAEKDEARLRALTDLYAAAYKIIGCTVAVVGIALLPFITCLIAAQPDVAHLSLIYLLFVARSSVSYFFSHKRAIIAADQKEYINSNISNAFLFVAYVGQILVLYATRDYLLYLSVSVTCSLATNIAISAKANKLYPFLVGANKPKLNREEKRSIFKGIFAMTSHKVGRVVVNSTDNLLISAFIGVYWVGLYSNYQLIAGIVNGFVLKLFASVSASIGNLNETESRQKVYAIFEISMFVGFWVFGFCSICFFVLFQPFITVWIGDKYLLPLPVVFLVALNYYLVGLCMIPRNYVFVTKLFTNTKWRPWAEAFVNLVVSIILLRRYGLPGVFIGTFVAVMSTSFWVDPYVLFKYRFERSSIPYYLNYLVRTGLVVITGGMTYFLCGLIENIIAKCAVCITVPNAVFYAAYCRTEEFRYLRSNVWAQLVNRT